MCDLCFPILLIIKRYLCMATIKHYPEPSQCNSCTRKSLLNDCKYSIPGTRCPGQLSQGKGKATFCLFTKTSGSTTSFKLTKALLVFHILPMSQQGTKPQFFDAKVSFVEDRPFHVVSFVEVVPQH